MKEIIQKLVSEVKIDEATAQKAIDVILGVVKSKLPAPIADQVANVLEGADAGDLADKAAGFLGGLMK